MNDWPKPYTYKTNGDESYDLTIARTALQIHQKAQECEKMSLSESDWNSHVHIPLLELVVNNPKYNGTLGAISMYV